VVVGEGESVEQALRRLDQWILKSNRWPVFKPKPTKRRQDFHQTDGQLQRQRAGLAKTRQKRNTNRYRKKYVYLRRWHEQNPYA
jgi:ribosomal protein S21